MAACVRHPWWVLAAALLLTVAAAIGIARLPILTSREALLPKGIEVSKRLDRFLADFGAASDLIVVIEKAPRAAKERFATELAGRVQSLPEVRQAFERVDLRFFMEHAYLLVPAEQLAMLEELLGKLTRAAAERTAQQGLFAAIEQRLSEPRLLAAGDVNLQAAAQGLEVTRFLLDEWQRWLEAPAPPNSIQWQRLAAGRGADALISSDGFFTSRDGGMLFLFVGPRDTSQEFGVVGPFVDHVRAEAEALRAEWRSRGDEPPEVALTGLPAIVYEEFTAVRRDVLFTVATAAVCILLVIGLWLRSVRWALAIFVPMGLGVAWNTGLTLLTVGHLTILTSSFTAVLFGLGVDYGIFTSTRIIEELRAGRPLAEAITHGIAAAARAVFTAAGATALIFAALVTVEFPGFVDLGLVAATGILLVIAATWLVQPALFALWPPRVAPAPPAVVRGGHGLSPAVSALVVLVAVGAAVGGGLAALRVPFDYDVLTMLPRGSEAAEYQRRMVEESDFQGEVIILTAASVAEARELAEKAASLGSIGRVETMTHLFPADAAERAEVARRLAVTAGGSAQLRRLAEGRLQVADLDRIDGTLEKVEALVEDAEELAFSAGHAELVSRFEQILGGLGKVRAHLADSPEQARVVTQKFAQELSSSLRVGVDVLSSWSKASPMTPGDLPGVLRDRFFGAGGQVAVYAFPAESVYVPEQLDRLLAEIYSVDPDATGFPTTHGVFSRMVVNSAIQGTLLALALAMIWIFLAVRSWRSFAVALLPLLVGGGWMLGALALFDVRFSYANVVALPLLMGLAVDYGVWFAHRRNELAGAATWRVTLAAGRAILLAAGTTLAGLGAITMATHRGVSSLGLSITIGLCCCVVAALVVSPALAVLLFGRQHEVIDHDDPGRRVRHVDAPG